MYNKIILDIKPLGFMWETIDPFLFCVHHKDDYPPGREDLSPAASLQGRNLGQDFTIKDGWRMYHGEKIPGFPAHPHRGFETVTIVLNGYVDHSDSHGAAGRYGEGDVQWMTAGSGLQHSEMFPMLNKEKGNFLELFQVWLNLPKKNKFAKPHFKMLWAEDIPVYSHKDDNEKTTEVIVIAGKIGQVTAPAPAPDSWASDPNNEVAIWRISMQAGATWNLPAASSQVHRTLYFYSGNQANIAGFELDANKSAQLLADQEVVIKAGDSDCCFLLLQGLPINEPVAQYGPFVMNTQHEIQQAINDFRATQFGGWPWPNYDNVHPRSKGRFSKFSDGTLEEQPTPDFQ